MSNLLSPASATPKNKNRNKYSRVANEDDADSESHDFVFSDYDEKSKADLLEIRSKWDSRLFDVKPATPKESAFELSQYFNEFIDRRTRIIVVPTFVIIILGVITVWCVYFIAELQGVIAILTICGLTWLGSLIGLVGVYQWGSVEGCIEYFEKKNVEYESELSTLRDTKESVKQHAKSIHSSVGELKQQGIDLEKNLEAFEELRQRLQSVCGDNQTLKEMLDQVNQQYDEFQSLLWENQKAHLLSIYLETSYIDKTHGLSETEYKRFLMRLTKETRKEFEQQGGFQAMDKDGNGIVDLKEFQVMLDDVLAILNEEQLQLIKQRSTVAALK